MQPGIVARWFALTGQPDSAFAHMRQAVEAHSPDVATTLPFPRLAMVALLVVGMRSASERIHAVALILSATLMDCIHCRVPVSSRLKPARYAVRPL